MHINLLKTSAQAEIEIRMIGATYIALIGKKWAKPWAGHHTHVIIYTILYILVSLRLQHGETKVEEPHQFNSFSNYKKLPTYNESKHENKENVSNSDHGGMKADNTYMEKLVN